MSETNIALFGLIGAIVGAIPALLGVVVPWLRDRDRTSTDRRNIELAKAEVELISTWLDAVNKVPGDEHGNIKALARERLYRLLDVSAPIVHQRDMVPAVAAGERPKRGAFFIYLGFYCFLLFGASIDDSNNVSLSHLLSEATGEGAAPLIVLCVPLIFLFIRWRRSVKKANSLAEERA